MTIIDSETRRCSVCGSNVNCTVLCSTNTLAGPDLDLRPAEMQRSTMYAWLQECTNCNYVAKDIEQRSCNSRDVIDSSEYQSISGNKQIPELASRFLRYSLLHQTNPEISGQSNLYAAWVFDDAGDLNKAKKCRSDAGDKLNQLRPFVDSEGGIGKGCRLVDVFRRSSRYDESIALSVELKKSKTVTSTPFLRNLLDFQESLCKLKDTSCYNIAEVDTADSPL